MKLTSFQVAGQKWSLYDYENRVVRGFDESRVHFVLNCMSVGCPRLPRVAFSADRLESQLESAREFMNSEKYVRLEPSRKRVYLSEVFRFYEEDFVSEKDGLLIAYINRYRGEPIPKNYRVEYIHYDWTVNNSAEDHHHP